MPSRLLGAFTSLCLVPACSSSTAVDPADAAADPTVCPTAATVACSSLPSYQNDISPILDTYCNNCHSAKVDGGPWPLGGYNNVHDWQDLMVIDLLGCSIPGIAHGHVMPPRDAPVPLPGPQRDTVIAWLLCGAPDN